MKKGMYYSKCMWYYEIAKKEGFKEVIFGTTPPNLELINKYLVPTKDKRILELGCGYGRESQKFAELFGEVVAIDINKEVIERAKGYAKDKGITNINFLVYPDDIHLMEPESFDCLYSYLVFQHCPDNIAEILLLDGSLMLKKGGIFLLEFMHERLKDQEQKFFPDNPKHGHCNIARNDVEIRLLLKDTRLDIKHRETKIYTGVAGGTQFWYAGEKY